MNEYQQKLAKLFSDIETAYSLRLRLVQLVKLVTWRLVLCMLDYLHKYKYS